MATLVSACLLGFACRHDDSLGSEVTARFEAGALAAVSAAHLFGARFAILKQNSPSCGRRMTGAAHGRVAGQGVTALALVAAGVEVRGEDGL